MSAALRTSWFIRFAASPLTSVIVAAILGVWLTHYYGDTRLKTEHRLILQRAAEERESARQELESAKTMEVFENISSLLDKRLWHLHRLIWISDENPTADELARTSAANNCV